MLLLLKGQYANPPAGGAKMFCLIADKF